MTDTLTLEVDGEQVVLDESFMDFSDFTLTEAALIAGSVGGRLVVDGQPSAGATALMLTVKLARHRSWNSDQVTAVFALLTAWLTDSLAEV
jgi:hypothetical protein